MFSLKRFLLGLSISFLFLTWLSTKWIPYDYPTELDFIVWYWKARDQLFRVHNYGLIFLPISIIIGLFLGYLSKIKSFIFKKK
ncbi:hypothetical protein TherJR_0573 [Thermincola potens JR]|uniref:Uncharacterized protein n=1 Tax=Thermincola potens (strain JR) TaxID=635013 RepID=D5XBQ0_THEPJ|nr:hypothetical protein TherJR_0573 [Thermincola potens JR]